MKKKIVLILGLLVVIGVLMVLRINTKTEESKKELEVVLIEPLENSQVLASKGRLDITITFSKDIGSDYDNLRLIDGFGLTWEKDLIGANIVQFLTLFGKEIMSVEELKIELLNGNTLVKDWVYVVPIDEKMVGEFEDAQVEEGASFLPDEDDIKYFAKTDEEINKDQPLWKLLPYETEEYKVSHYIKPLTLVVYLKGGADKAQVESEVLNWIKENGGNEKLHKLEFRE